MELSDRLKNRYLSVKDSFLRGPNFWNEKDSPLETRNYPYKSTRSQHDGELDIMLWAARNGRIGLWIYEQKSQSWYYPRQSATAERKDKCITVEVPKFTSPILYFSSPLISVSLNRENFVEEYFRAQRDMKQEPSTQECYKKQLEIERFFTQLSALVPTQTLVEMVTGLHHNQFPPKYTKLISPVGISSFMLAGHPESNYEDYVKLAVQKILFIHDSIPYASFTELVKAIFKEVSDRTKIKIIFEPLRELAKRNKRYEEHITWNIEEVTPNETDDEVGSIFRNPE